VVATFDTDDDQSPGQPADRTAERVSLTDPERVAADRDPRGREVRGPVRRHQVDRTGFGSAAHRVDDDREIDPGPRVEKSGRLAVAEPDLGQRAQATPGRSRHDPSDPVVAPRGVADADHDGAAGHERSTLRSRKCVAHEMQGS
jgi:hypothetical protein